MVEEPGRHKIHTVAKGRYVGYASMDRIHVSRAWGPAVGFCEHGSGLCSLIKGEEFDQLSDC